MRKSRAAQGVNPAGIFVQASTWCQTKRLRERHLGQQRSAIRTISLLILYTSLC